MDHRSSAELGLERLERKLRTVQLALEILTGVCATLPDPEPLPEGGDEEDENGGTLASTGILCKTLFP